MHQLNSKNYESVLLKVRDYDDAIKLDPSRGAKLMDYLVSGQAATHVKITLEDGTPIIVKTTDIIRVEPVAKMGDIAKYV